MVAHTVSRPLFYRLGPIIEERSERGSQLGPRALRRDGPEEKRLLRSTTDSVGSADERHVQSRVILCPKVSTSGVEWHRGIIARLLPPTQPSVVSAETEDTSAGTPMVRQQIQTIFGCVPSNISRSQLSRLARLTLQQAPSDVIDPDLSRRCRSVAQVLVSQTLDLAGCRCARKCLVRGDRLAGF